MRGTVVTLAMPDGRVVPLGIGRDGNWVPADAAWPMTELGDDVALPGLVDAHAHLSSADTQDMNGATDHLVAERIATHATAQLEAGVLLVADKGTHLVDTVAMTHSLTPSHRPEVQLAGRFLANQGGYYHGYAIEVPGDELVSALDAATPDGAVWVKIIGDWPRRGVGAVPNFDENALRRLSEAAHVRGLRTAIHTAAPETPGMAVRAGVDSIEHGLFLTEDDLAQLGARGGGWVPTVAAMEKLAQQLGPESSGGRLLAEGLDNVRSLLPHAAGAGVAVMAGTDLALEHGAVVDDALTLLEYGLDEAAVVEAVTTGPRRFLNEPGFTFGRPADFIVVDQPDSVAALAAPQLVVRCGVVVVDARG